MQDHLQGSSSGEASDLPPAPHVARTTDSKPAAHKSASHSNRLTLPSLLTNQRVNAQRKTPVVAPFGSVGGERGGVMCCVVHKASFMSLCDSYTISV